MDADRKDFPPTFWMRWVIATTFGFIIGGAISGALVMAGEIRFASVTSPWIGATALAAAEAVAFGLHGAVLGGAQSFAMRSSVVRPGRWFLATTGGWAAAGILSGILGGAFGGALTGVGPDYGRIGRVIAFAGGITFLIFPGLLQWLALRREAPRAGWWIPAQALSFLAATAVSFPAMMVIGRAVGWDFPSAPAWGLMGIVAGLIYGAISGALLIRLLRQPGSEPAAGSARQAAQ